MEPRVTQRRFRAVVFDLGGTLVDTQGALMAAMRQTIGEFGLPCPDGAALRANLGWAEPLLLRGLVPPGVEERATGRLIVSMRANLAQARPIAGAQAALAALREMGLSLALVSGFSRPTLEGIINPLGWGRKIFAAVVSGDDAPRPRPAPDLLLAAAGRLCLPASACLAVGDSLYDLRSAAACGMAFAGVLSGAQAGELATLLPEGHALASVADLPHSFLLTENSYLK
jgi:HAD superfamily hydrolase (TIGR01509 family)